jgi:hypothetical protein
MGEHSMPLAPPAAFANPPPPPRRAVPQTPLSNADFRKARVALLVTRARVQRVAWCLSWRVLKTWRQP